MEKEEKNNHLVTDTELLARFYGSDEKLDPSERFLRNYILNEGWKDKTQMAVFDDPKLKKIDKEDDERLDEMEAYETAYNFRYEDPNAATITSHARNALASETMRRKEETRKLARERKKERKEEEKNLKREERN
jgi:protein KRI1